NFLRSMSSTLPPMLSVLKDIGGVELPETLVKLAEESATEKKQTPEENGAVAELVTKTEPTASDVLTRKTSGRKRPTAS
ncbi:MAG: hypothetical protein AAGJ97_01955, partial [Planctomycetota bacterium]